MISSNNKDLDEFFSGYLEGSLNMIYGVAASGKTTLAKMAAISEVKKGNKVVFIDAEGSFSIDRIKQMELDNKILDSIYVVKTSNFDDLCRKVKKVIELIKKKKTSLVIIDTIGIHYRAELKNKSDKIINSKMAKLLKDLNFYARENNVCVLLTNQVYCDIETGKLKMVGGSMIKNWCKKVIELKKNGKRELAFDGKKIEIEIVNEGIIKKN